MLKRACITLTLAQVVALAVLAYAATAITRVSDHQAVTQSQMVSDAARSDLVLMGEIHDNSQHHEFQLSVLRTLWERKVPFAIGLEMFEVENQQALDAWSAGKISEPDFLAIYSRNWSLDWRLYRDIFIFARDHHIPMVALNIPKELVAKVARQGFASLNPEEKKDLPQGTSCDLNNPHTALLRKSFREVFRHANGHVFDYFCEAQTLRNSGMAMNIVRYGRNNPGRKIVVLAGIWHAVKNAIPEQLERNGSKLSNTVILPDLPELNQGNATPDVVDYMVSDLAP